jgi:hypothetical protein
MSHAMSSTRRSDELARIRRNRQRSALRKRQKLDEERKLHYKIKEALRLEMKRLLEEEEKRHLASVKRIREGSRNRPR